MLSILSLKTKFSRQKESRILWWLKLNKKRVKLRVYRKILTKSLAPSKKVRVTKNKLAKTPSRPCSSKIKS